jgi:aryl-alcohol dehydrogenase-like predicted oxidoreductase
MHSRFQAAIMNIMDIEKRRLGRTGVDVTILGLGGEGVLRTFGQEREAYDLINHAIDLGINYFESARAYAGSELYYGKALQERRNEVFLASKSHARDKEGALSHLSETLKNMKTDYLDLWQIHDVRTDEEIDSIFGPGGALEAFVQAKQQGRVRFIGITGHHDPNVMRRSLNLFDFDTVLMPVNPAEPQYKSFLSDVLPLAQEKGMGIIGMKVYARGLATRIPWFRSMEPFFRFALTNPITTAVIGCDGRDQLETNVRIASAFTSMEPGEMSSFVAAVKPYARQLMYYKP